MPILNFNDDATFEDAIDHEGDEPGEAIAIERDTPLNRFY